MARTSRALRRARRSLSQAVPRSRVPICPERGNSDPLQPALTALSCRIHGVCPAYRQLLIRGSQVRILPAASGSLPSATEPVADSAESFPRFVLLLIRSSGSNARADRSGPRSTSCATSAVLHPSHRDHLLWHARFGDEPRYATPASAAAAREARERAQAMRSGSPASTNRT